MKLSLMTYTMWPLLHTGKMDMSDLFAFAKKTGFEAIEFSISDLEAYDIGHVRKLLADNGLKSSCINGHFELASGNNTAFINGLEGAKKMLDTAALLETPYVMIVPAFEDNIEGFADKPRAAERIAAGLREIVKYAERLKITVTVEDYPNLLYPLGTIREMTYLLDSVPGLRLTFDNGNFMPAGEDFIHAYDSLWKHVANVHIKDWELVSNEKGIPCRDGRVIRGGLHGEGMLDHKRFLKALKERNYSGYLTFEYEGVRDHAEATTIGIGYIRKVLDSIGE